MNGKPQVVIIGPGFGGLKAAQVLAKAPVHITVIDRSQGLPHVSAAALPGCHGWCLAWRNRRTRSLNSSFPQNTEVLMGEATDLILNNGSSEPQSFRFPTTT